EKFPGLSASDIDRKVGRYADKTHRRRTRTIARTETARAQNLGYAQGMEDIGVEKLEFSSSAGCCDECAALDGKVYKVNEAKGIIPVHPNCRCAMLPVVADTPTCRGVGKSIEKAKCIPPENLRDGQIKSLLNQIESTSDTDTINLAAQSLRTLGYKKDIPKLKIKPTTITEYDVKQQKWMESLTEK
ncbi:unnamed protein product, partial [marine sediment metagenome]